MAFHYTNASCPFSHRAMFARALRPPPGKICTHHIPYGRHLEVCKRQGLQALKGEAALPFKGKSLEELQAIKTEYMQNVNPTGEVPSLKTATGEIVTESEILAEYFDMVSTSPTPKLLPDDPVDVCRVRLAMKRFNDVIPWLFALLRNQEPSKDEELGDKIRASLDNFESVLSTTSSFCVGNSRTLADVHCATFLHRLSVGLAHWRDFHLLESPRIAKLLEAVTALPEFQNGNIPKDEIVANYEFNAHGFQWAEDGTTFGGRGQTKFGMSRLGSCVTLHYFPVRGRAEALRMILRQARISYVDRLYSKEEWAKVKTTMPEGKGVPGVATRPAGNRGLPVLELEAGDMIPETADIARFIAQQATQAFVPLCAEKSAEAYEMMVASNIYPLMFPACLLASYPEEVAEAIIRGELPETYHGKSADLPRYSTVLPVLQSWEARLGDSRFFGGEVPHYGEFALFTVLDSWRQVDPPAAESVGSKLRDWFGRMAELPAVAGYLKERPGGGVPGAHAKPGSILAKYVKPAQRKAGTRGGA